MNYYKHHLGDYAQATAHLSFIEDAAYSRLIRKYYSDEEPLPADVKAVQRLVGARTKEERQAVADMLDEFFVLEADGWHNKRCDEEIARYQDKQCKARNSAETRWQKRIADKMPTDSERNANASEERGTKEAQTQCENDANALRTHCDGNANHKPISKPPPNPPKGGVGGVQFKLFWAAYPRKVGKGAAERAFANARINGDLGDVLAALEAQKRSEQWLRDGGRYIPYPATWLNQRRWEDELPAPGREAPRLAL